MTFGDTVTVYGDGTLPQPLVIAGDKLSQEDALDAFLDKEANTILGGGARDNKDVLLTRLWSLVDGTNPSL